MTAVQRKAQIVDVAIALFGRHGFKGTTTKALARAAGVSEATIFKHFPTKDNLYAAAFQRRTGVGTVKGGTKLDQMAEENQTTRPLGRVSENGCAAGLERRQGTPVGGP